MIIKYSGPDDIDMLVNMCEKLPRLRTLVLLSSHKNLSESVEEIRELLEYACFEYGGVVRIRQCNDTLSGEFENGSSIVVTVAKECVRGQRAHVIEYDPDVNEDFLKLVAAPRLIEYNQIYFEGTSSE